MHGQKNIKTSNHFLFIKLLA